MTVLNRNQQVVLKLLRLEYIRTEEAVHTSVISAHAQRHGVGYYTCHRALRHLMDLGLAKRQRHGEYLPS
jgi:predicted transcriptional regulator